jgi:hypothetical protein
MAQLSAADGRQPSWSGAGRRGGRLANTDANALSAAELSARFGAQKSAGGELGGEKKTGEEEGEGVQRKVGEGVEVDAEVCWICASPIVHESIAPCNHRTCHICCLRMRALYKDKNCAHCRVGTLSITT